MLPAGQLPGRVELVLHGLTTAALVTIAAGLGQVIADASQVPEPSTRWLLGGGMAAYFGLGALAIARRAHGRSGVLRLALWLVTGVVVPLALAAFADHLSGVGLAWYAALVVFLHFQFIGPQGARGGSSTTL